MYFLIIILILVILYKFYTIKEGFYNSINPCFDKESPYIKFGNMFVCFDEKNKVENTLTIFYGKEKDCIIDPKNTMMTLYDIDGNPTDNISQKTNKICKPYKVNIE